MKPAEIVFTEALQASGVSLDELIERGREIRGQLFGEMYGLKDE